MAIKFVDRVPTYPNRIKFTAEDGTVKYGVWERADSPTVVGTPINAANLNAMQQSAGLSGNVTLYVSTNGSDNTGNGTSGAPYATITKALNAIPKIMNGFTAQISIGAGTYNETVDINGYSNGHIILDGVAGVSVSISRLNITNSRYVEIRNISITISGSYLDVRDASTVRVYTPFSANGGEYGIHVNSGSIAIFSNTVTINNSKTQAVAVTNAALAFINNIAGSGNAIGISATNGGVCRFAASTLSATAQYYTFGSGRIYSGPQTSIPNY